VIGVIAHVRPSYIAEHAKVIASGLMGAGHATAPSASTE
jgi:hypothetical protein